MCRAYHNLVKLKKEQLQLDALVRKDPKPYWSIVNSLKDECNQNNDPTDSNSWSGYFKDLNAVQDKFKSRINGLAKILKEDESSTFNFLDAIIKPSEISNSI